MLQVHGHVCRLLSDLLFVGGKRDDPVLATFRFRVSLGPDYAAS
jgi:hypothetical protein